MEIKQIGELQKVKISWNDVTKDNTISIKIIIKHNNIDIKSIKITDIEELLRGYIDLDVFYGKHKIYVTEYYNDDNKIKFRKYLKNIKVFASVYNVAPLTASMPVTLFSLNIKNMKKIPTFVWFNRSGVWDWNNIPENIYPIPVSYTVDKFLHSKEEYILQTTSEWIKELYSINNDSFFNFYYNDYDAYSIFSTIMTCNIPKKNYQINLLSDGTASFLFFNKYFNDIETFDKNYRNMKNRYLRLKTEIAQVGKYDNVNKYSISIADFKEYVYIFVRNESNIKWWLTKTNGAIATQSEQLYNKVVEPLIKNKKIILKNLTDELKKLTQKELEELKKVYNLENQLYNISKCDKMPMVILGTWDMYEYDFESYVNACKAYFGEDKYVYFYKGHPKNPTKLIDGKMDRLKKLNLIDIDSTIPFELFLFLIPNIKISGYPSTSFIETKSKEQCGAIFNLSRLQATESLSHSGYSGNIQVFINVIKNNSEFCLDDNNKYLLLDDGNNLIYNATEKKFLKT